MAQYYPLIPPYDLDTEVVTYQDAVEHVVDAFDLSTSARGFRHAKRAVLEAYREVASSHRWAYLNRNIVVITSAPITTGTITYTHSTRTVTFTSGVVPADAEQWRIRIEGATYEIESGTESSTSVVLTENGNPGANVSSGTSYTLLRSTYNLPISVRKISQIFDETGNVRLSLYSEDEVHYQSMAQGTTGTPARVSVRGTGDYYSTSQLVFGPAPSAARKYSVTCLVDPRPLKTYKYNTGTLDCLAGAVAVSGNGTVFASSHVGALIRTHNDSTNAPTAKYGGLDGDYPYAYQRVISAVGGTIALTIDAAFDASQALSGEKYVISDPVDIDTSSMLNWFYRNCEFHYSRLNSREDRDEREAAAQRALSLARAADGRTLERSSALGGGNGMLPSHLRSWSTIPSEVVN